MAVRNHRRDREVALGELRRREGLEEYEMEKIEIQRRNEDFFRQHRIMTPAQVSKLFSISSNLVLAMNGPPRAKADLQPANETDFSVALCDSLPTTEDIAVKGG